MTQTDVLQTRGVLNVIERWPRPDTCLPVYDLAEPERYAGFVWEWRRQKVKIRAWTGVRNIVYLGGIMRLWLPLDQLSINDQIEWDSTENYMIDFAWYSTSTVPTRINGLEEAVAAALAIYQTSLAS